ncbi:CDP-glycerol glycerophosphotransferase family protein, partial [Angustibacter aerolatus]
LVAATAGLLAALDVGAGAADATALLLVVPGLEGWTRRVLDRPRLRVLHLPGLDYAPAASAVHRALYPAGLAVAALALVVAAVDGPVVVTVVATGLLVLLLLGLLVADVRLLRASDVAREQVLPALEAYQPEFVLYYAATAGAGYQVGMWMPYLERLGRRFVVVTRFASSIGPIAELTDAPIVHCPTLRSLDDTMASSVTTVFYVNNGLKNTHYVERRELTHVWLNHGDSEKPACFNPVHAIYDRIFTAGQAGIDRYGRHGVDIDPAKFEVVGRPQVEAIDVVRTPVPAEPTVLYAPTWVGPFADTNVYSLPVGRGIVQALLDRGCTVIFRAHPLNYGYPVARRLIREIGALLDADRAATGRQHLWGRAAEQDLTLEECFNRSDAMVADVSAVVSDYLYSEKPFSIVAVDATSDQLVAEAPVAVAAYVLSGDLHDVDAVLDGLLVDDPLREQRRATKTYYLGDFPADRYAEGFLDAARRVVDTPRSVDLREDARALVE